MRAWRGEEAAGRYDDIPGFCKSVAIEDLKKKGYVLTPGRYIGLADEKENDSPFEERMQKLSLELRVALAKGRELENEIEKNLKEFGF